MQTLSLQRLEKNRPALNIFTKNGKDPALFHEALLDTGAVFPVFTKGTVVLASLGDENGSIIFPNMSILCIDDPTIGFPFVLSALVQNNLR